MSAVKEQDREKQKVESAIAQMTGGAATVVKHVRRSWASITFRGARHRLTIVFDGAKGVAAGEKFVAVLPEYEWAIPHQLVADAEVVDVDCTFEKKMVVRADLLMIEDR